MNIRKPSDIIIEDVKPQVENGKFPAKGSQGLYHEVSARIFSHGTKLVSGTVEYKKSSGKIWKKSRMSPVGDDIFVGHIFLESTGMYKFRVSAEYDEIGTWLRDLKSWHGAGEDIRSDLLAGIERLKAASAMSRGRGLRLIASLESTLDMRQGDAIRFIEKKRESLEKILSHRTRSTSPVYEIVSLRQKGYFSSWYEMFPRSQTRMPGKHGTFKDCIERLEDIAEMGFDVVYFPPIHPIGVTNRRGKNGIIPAGKDDPGSPWAIGNASGGHKSVHQDLGTLDDFREFIKKAREYNIEVALDLAYQTSPDHPYVKEHPEWYYHRPDGTIRYAENPPKKYYDIYPLNFETENWKELWNELLDIVLFWASNGVRIFRVDNPHTKPIPFWQWLIAETLKKFEDVIFLSEAFTKPSVMYELSKIGFHQSYTYFTWRNFDWEIREYFSELNSPDISSFFRPMLFTNTPDILPFILQRGGKPAFILRAILAATLSPLWGIYSGYELCENEGIPGKEEYLNSEKYEIKVRNWKAPGNIRNVISKLNRIRREYVHFQSHGNVRFHSSSNPNIVVYSRKYANEKSVLVTVNINPYETHEAFVETPEDWSPNGECRTFKVTDLLSGESYSWKGRKNYVRLIPEYKPAHILVVE